MNQALALGSGVLFVYSEPTDATIEVLEIDEVYFPGIALEPGAYTVRISKSGYEQYRKKIYIESREIYDLFVELKKSSQWTDPETGIELVWIPEGCFKMGCGSWAFDCEADEIPDHKVCVNGFWMSKYEITQDVWEKIMGENPSRFQKGNNYPVEHVSWSKAREFVSKLKIAGGYIVRLPTEAEWEYAARGGDKNQIYAGGNDLSTLGWYQSNSQGSTHPVGEKKANFFGLYDMSGNVWEWCQDIYLKDAYNQYQVENAVEEVQSVFRVRRGGSWDSGKNHLRSLFRGRYPPDLQFESNGLRIVVDPD
ncbi:MAG: SUMF1/EgtB/PvdO family nonheme iron enzyme [Desulfobacterales bacterium]